MIDTNELKGIIVSREKTQKDVALYLGIAPKTFYAKMKKGIFGSDEMEGMIEYLEIENPIPVFFAKQSTCEATRRSTNERVN